MANLMWFLEEDILDILLLEPAGDQPLASPTPEEEATLLSKPQEVQATAPCPPGLERWAPDPEDAAKLREVVTEPQGMQVCPQPLGFKPLSPLEDVPLIGIPNPDEVQSLLMPVSTVSMAMYKNEITDDLKYEFETQFLEPLHSESPNHRPKITKL